MNSNYLVLIKKVLNSFLQKTAPQRESRQCVKALLILGRVFKKWYSWWWWQRGRHPAAVWFHPIVPKDAFPARIMIKKNSLSLINGLLASTQVLSLWSLSLLRVSVQCLFSKMETFILWQHFVAMALFLLQQMTDEGAIILSAWYCGEGKAAQQLNAEVRFDWLVEHTTANQGMECPYKHSLTKLHFYEWGFLCGFPLLFTLWGNSLLCQENEKNAFWSESGTCWWTCVRGSVRRGYLLQVQVGSLGSLDKLLTLQGHSSVPGSQDYSCHIYICTVGSHICLGVSSNIKDKVVAGQAWSILLSAIENSFGTSWGFQMSQRELGTYFLKGVILSFS